MIVVQSTNANHQKYRGADGLGRWRNFSEISTNDEWLEDFLKLFVRWLKIFVLISRVDYKMYQNIKNNYSSKKN